MMGLQYSSQQDAMQTRQEAHENIEKSMKIWSTKMEIPKRGKGFSGDPGERKESEYKLS